MIVDVRTYTLIPRKMAKYLDLFEKHALPVMQRHGLELLGYYLSQIGPLNQVVHLWRYDSLADLACILRLEAEVEKIRFPFGRMKAKATVDGDSGKGSRTVFAASVGGGLDVKVAEAIEGDAGS